MSKENGLDGEINTEQGVTSAVSHSAKVESKEGSTKVVPYYKIFSFADSTDILLIALGTIAAVGNGITVPLMPVLLGNIVNAFGESTNMKQVVDEVSKVFQNFISRLT